MVRDTIDSLELMQTVRRIRTVAIRNTMDSRIIDVYKQQLNTLQRKYESEHVCILEEYSYYKLTDFPIEQSKQS